jgi:small subunit ribosomal protein S6
LPATTERQYELILMLDPEVPDERREEIAANARGRIESGGALKHDESWGTRKLAYDIAQRTEADYRFYRFAAESKLLDDLDHTLKITDGVLRFRIFRVDPRSPLITPPDPSSMAARAPRRDRRDDGDDLNLDDVISETADGPGESPAPASPAQVDEPVTEAAPEPAVDAAPEPVAEAAPEPAEAPSEPAGDEQ